MKVREQHLGTVQTELGLKRRKADMVMMCLGSQEALFPGRNSSKLKAGLRVKHTVLRTSLIERLSIAPSLPF